MNKIPTLGLYAPTRQFCKPNNYRLERILGNGAEILEYQRSQYGHPAYYYAATDRSARAYSFSTIKAAVAPILDPDSQNSIETWEQQVGKEEAQRIRTEAINAGKIGHTMLERWAAGKSLGLYPLNVQGYVDALQNDILPYLKPVAAPMPVVDDRDRVITLSEVFVVDLDRQFIGRLDLIVEIAPQPFNDSRVLLELKGSRREKSIEHMQGNIVQAVAYLTTYNRIAALFPDRLLPLDGVAIAYMYAAGNGQILPVLGLELQEYVEEWQRWLSCFHEVLGEPTAA